MDISMLRERGNSTFTVTELNNFIKNMFESNRSLNAVNVRGEISNFINHRSGHFYFSVKDSEAQIKAVMFRSRVETLKFVPENGMKVTVRGAVTVYPRDGSYQIYVTSMQPDGIGALYLAFEQTKKRLALEGLFDEEYKKPIPRYPRAIGVITSPEGAAVRDIINVTGRRYSLADLYIYPSLVQGELAEENLIRGIDYFNKSRLVDVIIIGRGGGSVEDLWAFNGEKLARKIFESDVPVISAVGHETDFTICDFVSDLRAPTPSAAAELAVPETTELLRLIDYYFERAEKGLIRKNERVRASLENAIKFVRDVGPHSVISNRFELVEQSEKSASDRILRYLDKCRNRITSLVSKLDALSPLSVLSRGYGIIELNGKIIKDTRGLTAGDNVTVKLSNGKFNARVTEVGE